MKKYIGFFAALLAVTMASCTNDDITIQNETVIEVNPKTVMQNFTYQINPGDLDGVDEDEELRVRLFVYDGGGKLVASETSRLRNYLTTAKFKVNLDKYAYYMAIAITDVVTDVVGNVPEYWGVTGESQLSTLKIEYLGSPDNFGTQEILGVKSEAFESGSDLKIDVEPAGSLIVPYVKNLHAISNIRYITMFLDRANDYFDFTAGTYLLNSHPDIEQPSTFLEFDTQQVTSNNLYTYKFLMPIKNGKSYVAFLDKEQENLGTKSFQVDYEQGKEYKFEAHLDPYDMGTATYKATIEDVTGTTRSSATLSPQLSKSEVANCCKAKSKYVGTTPSWMVKDLIK